MRLKNKVTQKFASDSYAPVSLRDDEYSELEMGDLHHDEDEI